MKKTLIILSLLFACLTAAAEQTGTFTDWHNYLDSISIKEDFNLRDYAKVCILPPDTKDTPLPDEKDNTYKIRKEFLETLQDKLTEAVGKKVSPIEKVASIEDCEGRCLVLETKILQLHSGNQALRVWVGFGAGCGEFHVQGRLIDSSNGNVLVEFKQRRLTTELTNHKAVLKKLVKSLGSDISTMINAFKK
ncbi:MAG: DUF4410 domain-containing protein [Bacteroidales bacterium]|nr:DUF4410 domain-containing protein [Bacteroidales bacterium]